MAEIISIGIIGCGEAARVHAQCLGTIEGAEIVACCDTGENRAAQFARDFHIPKLTTDVRAIFSNDAIRAVYICTHHDSHVPLALAACEAKKDIFMEKPLALEPRDCETVANAVARSGVKFFMGFKMRFYPMVGRARAFIANPKIIVAQMMDVRWGDDFWANDPRKGGGNALSEGVHTFDLLSYISGARPVRVFAEGGNYHHPRFEGMIDGLTATVAFENGAVASVTQGDLGHPALVSKLSFQLFDGSRSAHLYNRLKTGYFWEGDKSDIEPKIYSEPEETGYLVENMEWIRCLQTGSQPPCTVLDGWRATALVQHAFEAIRTNTPQIFEAP